MFHFRLLSPLRFTMPNVLIVQRENYCEVQYYKNIYYCYDSSIHAAEICKSLRKKCVTGRFLPAAATI